MPRPGIEPGTSRARSGNDATRLSVPMVHVPCKTYLQKNDALEVTVTAPSVLIAVSTKRSCRTHNCMPTSNVVSTRDCVFIWDRIEASKTVNLLLPSRNYVTIHPHRAPLFRWYFIETSRNCVTINAKMTHFPPRLHVVFHLGFSVPHSERLYIFWPLGPSLQTVWPCMARASYRRCA